jgi:hypothetical protein
VRNVNGIEVERLTVGQRAADRLAARDGTIAQDEAPREGDSAAVDAVAEKHPRVAIPGFALRRWAYCSAAARLATRQQEASVTIARPARSVEPECFVVECLVPPGNRANVVKSLRRAPCRGPGLSTKRRICRQPAESVRHLTDAPRLRQDSIATVGHDLRDLVDPRGDDRTACGLRLEQHHTVRFERGRQHEHIERAQDWPHIVVLTREHHRGADSAKALNCVG